MAEGSVLIAGSQWLQGKGVDVISNGGNYGTYYQCVELPQARLYPKMGWPRVFAAGDGGAKNIPEGSPGLTRYNPGSKYVPVPGDLVIENGTSFNFNYGHVSVVDYTDTKAGIIYAVEQNAAANGRVTYSYNASNYTGLSASRSVKCILHAPGNSLKNPGSSTAPTVTATIDSFNLNCHSYRLSGWIISSIGDLSKKTLTIYYMDASTGLELARQSNVEWKQRTDVKKAHGLSYDKVGFDFTAATPAGLLGKTFKILVRAGANSEGNQKVFDQKHSLIAAFNKGVLDRATISGSTLTLSGWHACNDLKTKTGHLLILMDNGSEVLRQDVTTNVVVREDVQKILGNQASGADKSGFLATITIPTNLKGKKVKVLSKRIGGPNASANITFDKVIVL